MKVSVNIKLSPMSIAMIARFMAVSPGADFVMVTRNRTFYSRRGGFAVIISMSTLFYFIRTYALTALIKDGLSQSLPSEKLLMKSQIASLSASFLTR